MFVKKYVFFVLIAFSLLMYPFDCFSAQSAEEIKKELVTKGFSQEIINLLNPHAQQILNVKVPAGVVWFATFDRESKSVTVDFQAAEKTHHTSVTVVSLPTGGCLAVQNTILIAKGACKEEAARWIDLYNKRGIKLKTEQENKEHIFLTAEGNLGIKIYLYAIGNLSLEVIRNVESMK